MCVLEIRVHLHLGHITTIWRGTIDSLVRFSADSSLIGPIKKKNNKPLAFYFYPTRKKRSSLGLFFYFAIPPTLQKSFETDLGTSESIVPRLTPE